MKKAMLTALLLASPTVAFAHAPGRTQRIETRGERHDDRRDQAQVRRLLNQLETVAQRRDFRQLPRIDAQLHSLLSQEIRETRRELAQARREAASNARELSRDRRYGSYRDVRSTETELRDDRRDSHQEMRALQQLESLEMRARQVRYVRGFSGIAQRRSILQDLMDLGARERFEDRWAYRR